MTGAIEARVSRRLRASAEQTYDAWLDPAKARRWMAAALLSMGLAGDMGQVDIDARVGGRFLFTDQRGDLEARHWGNYLELERPRRIVFTWIVDESEEADPSRVSLDIEADGDGCVATIVHRMDPKWAEWVPKVEDGWGRMLAAVEQA